MIIADQRYCDGADNADYRYRDQQFQQCKTGFPRPFSQNGDIKSRIIHEICPLCTKISILANKHALLEKPPLPLLYLKLCFQGVCQIAILCNDH
jgi:hypothetical protein